MWRHYQRHQSAQHLGIYIHLSNLHTSYSREAGQEGMIACNLHTRHIRATGVQICEFIVVVGGSVRAEHVIGAQFSVVECHSVADGNSWPTVHPRHQQHRGSPGLQLDRETHRVT